MNDIYPPEFTQQRLFTDGEAESLRKILVTRRLVFFSAVLLVFALLIGSAWGIYLIRSSQVDRGKTVDNAAAAAVAAKEGTEKIESCTTPGQKCFEEAQRRSGALLTQLINNNQASAAAAASCAVRLPATSQMSDYERYNAVLVCVLRVLAKNHQ